MRQFMVSMLVVMIGLTACTKEQKKKEKVVEPPEKILLQKAIKATGELAKLEAASSFTAKGQAVMFGIPKDVKTTSKDGLWRVDYTAMLGFPYTRVEGGGSCWEKRGWPVVQCAPEMRSAVNKFRTLSRAMMLWPLVKETDWTIATSTSTVQRDGKELDALTLKKGAHEGKLLLDRKTHLVVGLQTNARLMGAEGMMEVQLLNHEERCGIKMPTVAKSLFKGQVLAEEKITQHTCGPVDDALFKEPPQVEDGTVILKKLPASKALCMTHVGPYEEVGPKMGQLFGFIMQKRVPAFARAIMIYKKAPPKVKDPKKFVTDVCIRINRAIDDIPKGFEQVDMKPVEVLAAYGIGPIPEKTKQLASLLQKELKKRKRTAGPLRGIMHMGPGVPPDQTVNELQLPLR